MIMREGELATILQQQEEDKYHKSIGKEQQAMTSNPTGKALLFVQHLLSLHHFLQSYITQNLVVASKVITLAIDIMFFLAYCLLRLQRGI